MEQRLSEKTLQKITDKRQVILDGHVNCLPSPFTSFTRDFVGLEKPTYFLLTSYTKGGKTQCSLHLLFSWLMYAYENQYSTSLHIKYFCLEETDVGITMRFMSWLLNRLDGIRVSPSALKSTKYALSQDIIDKLTSERYQRYLEFFDKTFEFSQTAHSMGIFLECKKYCEEVGTVHYKTVSYNDKPVFDYYEANDPHSYNIMVVDHLSLVQEAKGQTKKQAMDQLSEMMATELRNKYGMCCYVIQQQSTAGDDNESIKLGRTRPSVSGLSDSKYSSRDADIAIGLYSPFRFQQQTYANYDITKFKDHFRLAEVLINRNGQQGGLIPLLFDGATCTFSELPPPQDTASLEPIYRKIAEWDGNSRYANLAFSKIK